MTVNEVINQINGWDEETKVNTAIEMLKDFVSEAEDLNKQLHQSLDFSNIASLVLCVAIASDGELESSEYALYQVMCNSIDVEPKSVEECENLLSDVTSFIDDLEGLAKNLRDVFEQTGRGEAIDNLCMALACIMTIDDDLSNEEIRLLSYWIGDSATSSDITASKISRTEDVKLVNYDASITRDDNCYHISVGAELKNPNVAHCAKNVRVKVVVKDDNGRILERSENTIDYIDSNATFYYGDEFSIERGTPANYSVMIDCDEFVEAPENSTFSDGITCSHFNVAATRWGRTEFTGNVRNGYSKKLWVDLYFVFYNSNGEITGGANTRSTLYAKSEDAFEIYLDTKADRDKVRCSATFDFMDLVD